MKRHKENMRGELKRAVNDVLWRYRVNGHLEHDKAIDEVIDSLVALKSVKPCGLLTKSEWLESKRERVEVVQSPENIFKKHLQYIQRWFTVLLFKRTKETK